jgi:5-oxoprolinase (ATP-hydrolysing)
MGPKNMVQMQAGDRCVIHTPGGGGWGILGSTVTKVQAEDRVVDGVGIVHVPRAAGSIAAFEETQGGQH